MCTRGFGPGLFTVILSTPVSSTLGSSKPVSSTNKYLDFKVRLTLFFRFMENSLLTFHFVEVKVKERSESLTVYD